MPRPLLACSSHLLSRVLRQPYPGLRVGREIAFLFLKGPTSPVEFGLHPCDLI